jgi:hypothetical protein
MSIGQSQRDIIKVEGLGRAICTDLAHGASVGEEASLFKSKIKDPTFWKGVLDAGIRNYCPQFVAILDSYAASTKTYLPQIPSYSIKRQDKFFAKARSDQIVPNGYTASSYERLGAHVCFLIGQNSSILAVGPILNKELGGASSTEIADLVLAAVKNLCPQYSSLPA